MFGTVEHARIVCFNAASETAVQVELSVCFVFVYAAGSECKCLEVAVDLFVWKDIIGFICVCWLEGLSLFFRSLFLQPFKYA